MGVKMEEKKKFLPFLRGIFRNVRCRKSLCSKSTVGTGRGCCWFDTTRRQLETRERHALHHGCPATDCRQTPDEDFE